MAIKQQGYDTQEGCLKNILVVKNKYEYIPIYNRDDESVCHLRTLYPTKGRDEN
jgi:hypothetical protein